MTAVGQTSPFVAPASNAGRRRKRSFKSTGSDGRNLEFVRCFSEELEAFKFVSRGRNELRAEAMIPVPGCGCRSPPATSTWAASRAVNIMRLELILRTVDVPEPLQRIRA